MTGLDQPALNEYFRKETSFNLLMQKRIRKVLLLCSSYDAFMLEEDGRIDDKIFKEYVSLHLSHPPVFIQTQSAEEAFQILEEQDIDLIIEMLSFDEIDVFDLADRFKEKYPKVPVVLLSHMSRELSLISEQRRLGSIDYVFSWLGNTDILLAIVKLLEDKKNAPHDMDEVGVQYLLLVEDSVRYISTFLPELYRIILTQSYEFAKEGLNEHQKMIRKRGRPKILLATNLKQAMRYYRRYQDNLLGVISDVSFGKTAKQHAKKYKAGIGFSRLLRIENPNLPIILQSSELENEKYAKEQNIRFIHKMSKSLTADIKDNILKYFGFGDFVFRDPETHKEIYRASDLITWHHTIKILPPEILEFHGNRNHYSRWLKARGLFVLASLIKEIKPDQFPDAEERRVYLDRIISTYRESASRGVIAEFDSDKFNEYAIFSRIGEGSTGGKARGLAFIDSLIKKYDLYRKYNDVTISIPKSLVLSTGVFEQFMEENELYNIDFSELDDQEILQHFVNASLPEKIYRDIRVFLSFIKKPVAVRSSSKLEDSYYQSFAGVYHTYMVNHRQNEIEEQCNAVSQAVKGVFASVFYKASRSYIEATSNLLDEEKMGIVIQEISGTEFNGLYCPSISGVARSINYYPVAPEKAEDGIVNIAFGLGRYIVDGDISLHYCPAYPEKIIQFSDDKQMLKNSQKKFYALHADQGNFDLMQDHYHISLRKVDEADGHPNLKYIASTFDLQNQRVRHNVFGEGKRIISFYNLLHNKKLPFNKIIQDVLSLGRKEMNSHVEIEFSFEFAQSPNDLHQFKILQIRPITDHQLSHEVEVLEEDYNNALMASMLALGNGQYTNIYDILYVDPELFDPANNEEIAKEVEAFNDQFKAEGRNYVLMGPGRWGSCDPWLGIPITWSQISEARIIIESGLENYKIEPSQGTHFFHNLTTFSVGYFTINPHFNQGHILYPELAQLPILNETKYLRHIRVKTQLKIVIDGKINKGMVSLK